MAVTYEPDTDRGKVRLLITDTDTDNPIFNDEEIDTFLGFSEYDGENDIFIAAAYALETIATSEALTQKAVKILDLSTNGPAVAKELRDHAEKLREKADQMAGFDIANMNLNTWVAEQLIINNALRDE